MVENILDNVINDNTKLGHKLSPTGHKNNSLKILLKAIRVHQFSKNILIFLPLFLGHLYNNVTNISSTILGFIAFCLIASSVYLLNDLIDLDTDRSHHLKKNRPLASGDLSITTALFLIPLFLFVGIAIAVYLNVIFSLIATTYFCLTFAYSLYFKNQRITDVFTLAVLYMIRVAAGVVIVDAVFSEWLLSFALFFFLSLAFVKRYSELFQLKKLGTDKMADKQYNIDDMKLLQIFGITSGFCSIIVLALYINSPAMTALYSSSACLWGISALLLFWVCKIWDEAVHGRIAEDPVAHFLYDKTSWCIFGMIVFLFFMASNHLSIHVT
ncbi:MAG: hypothetical protein A3F11_05935 [Gammaproteobacteria bacterium RIFCSPHIGHO2_12_FULL_37_14]|nr:MAG: hypothetical protein A3F11_05935 [Gammaproteobacteria bacterium RIFCSPHIGHO2_12_FULL_37_14]